MDPPLTVAEKKQKKLLPGRPMEWTNQGRAVCQEIYVSDNIIIVIIIIGKIMFCVKKAKLLELAVFKGPDILYYALQDSDYEKAINSYLNAAKL